MVILIFVLILGVFLFIKYIPNIIIYKNLSDDLFVCPNCGHSFHVKWYHLIFKLFTIYAYNQAKLRCPNCKIKDMCSKK